ncbi:hypothetical protein Poli38472_014531 [Pythium oligandrum]|uniref:Cleft lip and palate associated transmembrane protein n=1 Tax=Pythium oligandrum TaxID=41045 RepID=A0A8K1CE17_PYTOL|nr:hypothetical protein Poli38472_014531 [Pythium oligandrum]|eukprot:TMW61070.1 hypothetical protein Poli38472_014531 [Pythium oligandrum]
MTPPPAAEAAPEAPQGFFDRIFPYLRMFLMWYAFQSFTKSILPQPPTAPQPETTDPVAASIADVEVANDVAKKPLFRVDNAFAPGDPMALRVYVSSASQFAFDALDAATEREQLRWHQRDLVYSTEGNTQREDGQWVHELNVTVDEHLLNNGSVYAHVFLTKDGFSPNPQDAEYDRTATIYRTVELTTYRPRPKISKKRNLLAKRNESEEEAVEETTEVDSTYISMWKPTLLINPIFDDTVYTAKMKPPPFLMPYMKLEKDAGKYLPVLYLNDFWILEEHLLPINASVSALPLEIAFYTLPVYKFALYTQMDQNFRNQEATGTSSRRDTDSMKRMFLETNPYLLAVTIMVSLLHSLFDFLAFKNDVSFWKNQKSLAGLSLRTVVLNTFFQLVIFLYLLDNDTSWMVLISSFVSLLIDIWKIKKAVVFSRDANNRLVVSGVESYAESPTAEHDRVAVAHLSYVLYPLIVGYAVYSLAFGQHKGWYSWVVSSLTSFVYAFGFIMMTPQLYINYKLKSVAHLPWRAMIYKSLNTFIDDLFAFVIKMPWMHRLSCFRDDLIFFIYLYQRWIYPVDASRTNEFGQGPKEGEEDKEGEQPALTEVEGTTETPGLAAVADASSDSSTEYLMTKPKTE